MTVNIRKATDSDWSVWPKVKQDVVNVVKPVMVDKVGTAKFGGDPDTIEDGITSSHKVTGTNLPIALLLQVECGLMAVDAIAVRSSLKMLKLSISDGEVQDMVLKGMISLGANSKVDKMHMSKVIDV